MSELLAFDEIMDEVEETVDKLHDIVDKAAEKALKKKPVKKPTTKKAVKEEEAPKELAEVDAPEKEAPKKEVEAKEGPTGWHSSVIGTPTGYPNPHFRGVIGYDSVVGGKQVEIPFNEIKSMSRYIYVDDILTENPTILKTFYYVIGDFRTVIAFLPEDSFEKLLKLNKKYSVYYSYISPHSGQLRNYQLRHENWPTQKDLEQLDQTIEGNKTQRVISDPPLD